MLAHHEKEKDMSGSYQAKEKKDNEHPTTITA